MSAPIRLLISDIDGTLVRKDKSLGAPVEAACARLRAAGVRLALISARPVSGMRELIARTGADALCGAFNGGTLFRPGGEAVAAHRLSPDAAARALKALDRPEVSPWVFADGRWYATTTEGAHVPSERITAAQEPVIVAGFDALLDRVDKIVGVSDALEALAALEEEVASALGRDATVARSQAYYLDVTAPEADKGRGVRAIAEAADIPLKSVAVIGDGHNDVAMFRVAGFSVAMCNASDTVRAAAQATAPSNADDGVAIAIDELILPRA